MRDFSEMLDQAVENMTEEFEFIGKPDNFGEFLIRVFNVKRICLEKRYEEFIDEIYGDIQIAGRPYATSEALKEVDPTAYRCGMADWADSEEFVEIDGEYYEVDDVVDALDEYFASFDEKEYDRNFFAVVIND